MKYYRKPDGTVLCFKLDGSQDHLIEAGYVLLSDAEVALVFPPAKRRAECWNLIKEKRSEIKYGGVFVSNKWFHTDEESRSQYATMYAAISVNSLPDVYVFDANWKTMDGSKVPMSVALLKAIINTGMSAESDNYANAETHRVAMEASLTPETYNYSTGWTSVYVPV